MNQVAPRGNRRDDIVAAAGALFSARGYHGTSMRELAKCLDLQGSSLYSHFASKDDLLWAIVDGTAAAFTAAADTVPTTGSPRVRLEGLIAAHLRVISDELPYATVFFQDWTHLSDHRKRQLIAMRDDYQRRFHEVIAEGERVGEFTVGDVSLATLVLLSALNFSYHWLDPDGRLGHDELVRAVTVQLIAGLRCASSGAAATLTAGEQLPSATRPGVNVRQARLAATGSGAG